MTVSHELQRRQIIAEARTWVGTPYISNGCIKGLRGGVDCAMLLVAIYGDLGYIPKEFDPRPYSPQWHVHRDEEKYIDYVKKFAHEITTEPKAGDIVMFLVGQVHAHSGIVTTWPFVIHAMSLARVMEDDISKYTIGKRALATVPKRFFSLWKD